MIAYFDTSALVPLLIEETSSIECRRIWNESSIAVSSRVVYPEARAALAKARRTGRATARQIQAAVQRLDTIVDEISQLDFTPGLARVAGAIADEHDLRAYDAVHLASAAAVTDDAVLVTGDRALMDAAHRVGLAVAATGA